MAIKKRADLAAGIEQYAIIDPFGFDELLNFFTDFRDVRWRLCLVSTFASVRLFSRARMIVLVRLTIE